MSKTQSSKTRERQKERADKIIEREGTISVTRTVLGQVTEKTDRISIRPFATEPAFVSMKYGLTISMAAYESARIDVMVTLPCYKEEIREAYDQVKQFVAEKVIEEKEQFDASPPTT